jgi:hypothetical protein
VYNNFNSDRDLHQYLRWVIASPVEKHQVNVVSVVEMIPGDVLSPDWKGAVGEFCHRDGGPIGILCLRYLRHDGMDMKKIEGEMLC